MKRYLRKLYGHVANKQLNLILEEWMARHNAPVLFRTPQDYLQLTLFRVS